LLWRKRNALEYDIEPFVGNFRLNGMERHSDDSTAVESHLDEYGIAETWGAIADRASRGSPHDAGDCGLV
jgi:hypothetical protein